jgi:hypothetical protein
MKVNLSHLLALVTFILTVAAVSSAAAQDGAPVNEIPELGPLYQDPNSKEDKPLLYEPEGKSSQKEQPVNTPTATPLKAKAKTAEPAKAPSKTEEDALSFNFLYYIIQKFKISDIVDQ